MSEKLQKAEARLIRIRAGEPFSAVYDKEQDAIDDNLTVIDAHLAGVRRRQTRISPEALVAAGFTKSGDYGTVFRRDIGGRRLVIELDLAKTKVDDMQVGLDSLPYGLWPTHMDDVNNLCERLARDEESAT